jgi:hypothetical protein
MYRKLPPEREAVFFIPGYLLAIRIIKQKVEMGLSR